MGQVIGMIAAMRGHRVYVDTNIFVYFLERNADFFSAAAPVIQAIAEKELVGCTGEIAIAETMVRPYRSNDPAIIATTRDFFETGGFLKILPHDRTTFYFAAQLRAAQRIKLIDALHIATALKAACRYFITNDKAMRSTGTLNVVQLSSLL